MRWIIATHAEIARRSNEAVADMVVPNPIDDNAGQQRSAALVCVGYPVGKCPTLPGALGLRTGFRVLPILVRRLAST